MSQTLGYSPFGLITPQQHSLYSTTSLPVIDTSGTSVSLNEKVYFFKLESFNAQKLLSPVPQGVKSLRVVSSRYSVINPEQLNMTMSATTQDLTAPSSYVLDNKVDANNGYTAFNYLKNLYLGDEQTTSIFENPQKQLSDKIISDIPEGINIDRIDFHIRINGLDATDISASNVLMLELAFVL
jgi:hypothetical protein